MRRVFNMAPVYAVTLAFPQLQQRGQMSVVPGGLRQAVYGSAMAALSDWVVTFGDAAAEETCRLCYQWALQGVDGLHAPTVGGCVALVCIDMWLAPDMAMYHYKQAQEAQLSVPLVGQGVGRVPLATELVAPMCVALARVGRRAKECAAGVDVQLRYVSPTRQPAGAARALQARCQYELLAQGVLLATAAANVCVLD